MKVLLIEDDVDYANTITELFYLDDHIVEWTEKFSDTIKALNSKKWDVILCDVHLEFLPVQVIEECKSSDLNSETPILFLTAARETNLATQLMSDGEYPVISKFEIKRDFLSVIINYNQICNLIKSKKGKIDRNSFQRFISRYINDKKYDRDGLKQSLSGWISQLRSTLSKQISDHDFQIVGKQGKDRVNFRAGIILIDTAQYRIKYMSSSALGLLHNDSYKGQVVTDAFPFSRPEEIISLLQDVAERKSQVEDLEIMLRVNGVESPYFLTINKTRSTDDNSELLELEIYNTSSQIDLMDYLNLKETNKILLQEIHHRVNNNLNLILSLINLKLLTTNYANQEAYQEILDKINVISLVYEHLSQSEMVSSISFNNYFSQVLNLLQNNTIKSTVISKVNYGEDDLRLNVNQIIPLGLLLSEVIEICRILKLQFEMQIIEISDMVCIDLAGQNIALIETDIPIYQSSFQTGLIHSLLNSLGAILSTHGNDKIQIRFKKSSSKGIGSNLYE
jgi:two-component sensor histidine kinase/response regulator of citrate/malate metabolism